MKENYEEITEAMSNINDNIDLFDIADIENLDNKEGLLYEDECLQIIENGFYRESSELKYFVDSISVTSDESLYKIINEAKLNNDESLSLVIESELKIPAEIGELINLKCLEIECRTSNEKFIINLPPEIGNLKNLEVISAYKCNMKELPKEFSELKNLKSVNLNDNNFTTFPKELLQLKGLESLAINWSFETLPDELWEMVSLKQLYFPLANIKKLPEGIGKLKNLEVLCIWGTKIDKIPDACLELSNLKEISLTRSLFETILPPEIVNQSPIDVVNYIVRYQHDTNKIEVNESKMIIVGQGGVGKTCLLNRLIFDKYDETVSTEGIDIAPWKFEIKNKTYKLNVWDFGGQEIYHATHQFFLTNRSLYIFVWDARQEEEYGRIDYWLHTIESFAYNSPIIIVVNKCDSRQSIKQLDLKSTKEKFPQIIDSINVSCKKNIQIDHLRDVIKEETINLPLMGLVWLSSWLEVRLELETLAKSRNIITYEEYQRICRKHNILEGEALSLSKYLHDLGIILNFQNDLYLKNIVILNPDWGTQAVYSVLDAQETILKNRNGILYYDDLPQIWKDSTKYPEKIYTIILRLMENFQLSFEVSKNKEYLVAELLNNEEVKIEIDNTNKQILNFQYNYEFLPAGIMTRFIVKANNYLVEDGAKKACWKKGAYLKYEDSIGLVKLFDGITERKIEISVMGKNSRNNRDLLVIIRKYFNDIHNSVPKIKYTEYVKCNCSENCTYLHDYRYLLRLEQEKIVKERCKETLNLVDVSKLLDGVNDKREFKINRRKAMQNIHIKPTFVVENNSVNSSENSNSNSNHIRNEITIEIRNNINELQGSINDLKDEVIYDNPELEKEFDKLEKSTAKLNDAESKDDIVKSGALSRIKRFLDEIQDAESELGKVVRGIKFGVNIAQEIGEKYNSIAEWCGFPVIPKYFLGNKK